MLRHSTALKYSHSDIEKLRRFAAFLVIYVPYFQTAGNAADAQWEDLNFRRRLEAFRGVDADVADAVLVTWSRHVDFLSPEFAFLSLVSRKVSIGDKLKIAEAILKHSDSQILRPANLQPIPEITPETKLPYLA